MSPGPAIHLFTYLTYLSLGYLKIKTSPTFGTLNFGNWKEGIKTPISVYGIPTHSGVLRPYTKRLPIKKSPVIIVFSILPVGTMYASRRVTLTDRAINTIIIIAFNSDKNFWFPVLKPINANPIAPKNIFEGIPYFSFKKRE